MGREIRKVPPNWEHPRYTRDEARRALGRAEGVYKPLYNQEYGPVFAKWLEDFDKRRAGHWEDYETEAYGTDNRLGQWLLDDGRPPDLDYYLPYKKAEATWFQVYETVSEGTPVTPPFATKGGIVEYLCQHGDFWDQKRGDGRWSRQNAESFVKDAWAPSLIVMGGVVASPRDQGQIPR